MREPVLPRTAGHGPCCLRGLSAGCRSAPVEATTELSDAELAAVEKSEMESGLDHQCRTVDGQACCRLKSRSLALATSRRS
ncbi:hypothetical protein NXT3_PB00003 (plasmid) [Sinorhizobium fredii]|uniref:Uncharacterized protein n=1 Tax=Rhizobium fredii TaxID=380 RepID=A0A2L0HB80_RHIFR|nr:hypothetical protein NXT3_PB00003 [Sinorhizobium fredii]